MSDISIRAPHMYIHVYTHTHTCTMYSKYTIPILKNLVVLRRERERESQNDDGNASNTA